MKKIEFFDIVVTIQKLIGRELTWEDEPYIFI